MKMWKEPKVEIQDLWGTGNQKLLVIAIGDKTEEIIVWGDEDGFEDGYYSWVGDIVKKAYKEGYRAGWDDSIRE